jgi:hypothetical protein
MIHVIKNIWHLEINGCINYFFFLFFMSNFYQFIGATTSTNDFFERKNQTVSIYIYIYIYSQFFGINYSM